MSIINYYNDPTIISWNTDSEGNRVSVPVLNEPIRIINGRAALNGVPDEQYRVVISDYVEIDIKEKITETNQYKVDYTHSFIYFHPDLGDIPLTVDRYYSRGVWRIPASKVWTRLNDLGEVEETLEDIEQSLRTAVDMANDVQGVIDTGNQLKTDLNSSISNANTINNTLSNSTTGTIKKATDINNTLNTTISNANSTKSNLDGSISTANATKTALDTSIANGEIGGLKTDVNDLKQQVNTPLYTTIDTYSDIISMPENTTNGQVSVSVKGNTITNLVKNPQFDKDTADWGGGGVYSTDKPLFGNKSLKIESVTGAGRRSQNVENLSPNKFYICSAFCFIDSYIEGQNPMLRVANYGGLTSITTKNFNIGQIKQWQRSLVKFTNESSVNVVIGNTSMYNGLYYIDGVMLNEITEGDYNNLTEEELMKKYPYVSGTKSTISASRLKSVGENIAKISTSNMLNREGLGGGIVISNNSIKVANNNSDFSGVLMKVKSNTNYTFSAKGDNLGIRLVKYINKPKHSLDNSIAIVNNVLTHTFNTENSNYLFIGYYCVDALNNTIYDIQLEEGTVATQYEPYKESNSYIVTKDEQGKIVELRSLPNGTKDEVSVVNGKAEHIKRVSDTHNNFANWIYNATFNVFSIPLSNYNNVFLSTSKPNAILRNQQGFMVNNLLYTPSGVVHMGFNLKTDYLTSLGYTADSAGARKWANDTGLTLNYQLASEEIIPIQVSNPLTVFENGTIYVDPYLRETYNITGTTIALEYPITSIDKLVKIDGITETEVAGTLSSDGKTITVANAGIYRVEGEIRPEESTQGQKIIQVPTNMKAQINSNVDGIRMLSKTVDEHSLALLTLALRNL